MIKNTYIYAVIIVVIVGGFIFWMNQGDKTNNTVDLSTLITESPSSIPFLSPTPTPKPVKVAAPVISKSTPKPTPGIVIEELGQYEYWFDLLEPIDRRLAINQNCTEIVPSQVSYPNNTQIMLDNTFSSEAHTLKIGEKEYFIGANNWRLITLNETKLPARLTIFCGSMELGELELK